MGGRLRAAGLGALDALPCCLWREPMFPHQATFDLLLDLVSKRLLISRVQNTGFTAEDSQDEDLDKARLSSVLRLWCLREGGLCEHRAPSHARRGKRVPQVAAVPLAEAWFSSERHRRTLVPGSEVKAGDRAP